MRKQLQKLCLNFLLIWAVLLAAFPCPAQELPDFRLGEESGLFIVGNERVPLETLEEVIQRRSDEEIGEELAARTKAELLHYYYAQGYSLARIWTKVHQGKLFISIDEGKLEKIIVRGRGAITTLLLEWWIDLPGNVYNQRLLRAELDNFTDRTGIKDIATQIVKSRVVREVGFQLSDWGIDVFGEKTSMYELHIIIAPASGSGPGIGAITSPYYGFVPFVQYGDKGTFFENGKDKLLLSLETGYHIRRDLNKGGWDLRFTHFQTGGRYDFPPLRDLLRFYSESHLEISGFQRPDLPLDEYWAFVLHSSVNAGFDILDGFSIWFGGGAEYKSIFSIKQVTKEPFNVTPFDNGRFFAAVGLDLNLTPHEIRIDRLHTFSLKYEFYLIDVARFHRLEAAYKKVFALGYDDFIAQTKLLYTFGPTPFYEEKSLGGPMMRSFFKGAFYVDRAAWLSFEYRLSLWKDVIKISLYHDLAMFGQLTHDPNALNSGTYTEAAESENWALANSFGPGFHWLILDSFQFDLYGSMGFSPVGFSFYYYFEFMKVFL